MKITTTVDSRHLPKQHLLFHMLASASGSVVTDRWILRNLNTSKCALSIFVMKLRREGWPIKRVRRFGYYLQ